jgi:hypothetical protein
VHFRHNFRSPIARGIVFDVAASIFDLSAAAEMENKRNNRNSCKSATWAFPLTPEALKVPRALVVAAFSAHLLHAVQY